jgi:FeS assembly SUF system protein
MIMSENMSDDKPATEQAPSSDKAPENTNVVGSSTMPQAELNKLTDDIIAGLKTVYDPEIPADIYELGLIYKIDIGDDKAVKIDMSLTSPNCPSAQELPIMVENAVSSVPGVKETKVEVVWDPPWDPSRMSDEARLVLNMW